MDGDARLTDLDSGGGGTDRRHRRHGRCLHSAPLSWLRMEEERKGGAGADRPERYTVEDAWYGQTHSLGPSKNVDFTVPGDEYVGFDQSLE